MKLLVYIETTIPSYYCDDRSGLAADIARTREWWDQERDGYDCFVSAVVLDELGSGDYPNKAKCLALVQELPALEISARFDHDLEKYVAHLKEIERQHPERIVNQVTVIQAAKAAKPIRS